MKQALRKTLDIPLSAALGALLGIAAFTGFPLWLGYSGHSLAWLTIWTLIFAPFSPGGIEIIDEAVQPTDDAVYLGHRITKCIFVLASVGAIGVTCYAGTSLIR